MINYILKKGVSLRKFKELQTRKALFEGVQATGIPTLEEVLTLIKGFNRLANHDLYPEKIDNR